MRRFICAVMLASVLCTMAFIYAQSGKEAQASASVSTSVTDDLLAVTVPGYKDMPHEQKEALKGRVGRYVRAFAHGAEFASLSFFCMLFVCAAYWQRAVTLRARRRSAEGVFLFCGLYALSDEIHQSFVPGRIFDGKDILADCVGALAGICLFFALYLTVKAAMRQRSAKGSSKDMTVSDANTKEG